MQLTTEQKIAHSEDRTDYDRNYIPNDGDLSDYAKRWAEWHNHDPKTAEQFGSWFRSNFGGHPWKEIPNCKTGFNRFMSWVERETVRNTHPSRRKSSGNYISRSIYK